MIFDTLQYAKKLKKACITETQAEIQAEALAEIIEDKLATKQDLKELEYRLIIKMGIMLTAVVTILGALIRILK